MIKNILIAGLVIAAFYYGLPHAGPILAMFKEFFVTSSLGYGG